MYTVADTWQIQVLLHGTLWIFFFSKLLDPWLVEFLEPMIQRANGTEFGKSYRFIWEPGL